ncbi:MAG: GNAT family N-acetyltransferase [Rhodothermales bacterium]
MSARVAIVPTALEHAPAIQRLASHPDVAATTLVPHPYPDDGAVRFVEDLVLPGRAAGTQYAFVIVAGGEVVGHISVKNVDRARGEAEIGYWIGRPYWGRGYASEAVRRIVAFAFEEIGLRRLYAHVLAHNPASGRVLEKAGFVPVALPAEALPNACLAKGETLGYELYRAGA